VRFPTPPPRAAALSLVLLSCRPPVAPAVSAPTILAPQASSIASAPAEAQTKVVASSQGDFGVRIEQDGTPVLITDHQVRIDAKPFVIVIRFHDPDLGVHVNASMSPRWFEMARSGTAFVLGDSQDGPFAIARGLAEANLNPAPEVYLTNEAAHYWYYNSADDHRCHGIAFESGGTVCRRHVDQVASGDPPGQITPLADLKGADIHLVFVSAIGGTEAKDWFDRRELHREYLRVALR
jgi:hypothetical protein